MRISSAFPSNYLKAADLQGRTAKVTMSHVTMEEIGGDHKPVLYFSGKDKGIVLNKTNANNISAAYGDDTDYWVGKSVELFSAWVDFQGKTMEAIRVRIPAALANAAQAPSHPNAPASVQQVPQDDGGASLDDEIPF